MTPQTAFTVEADFGSYIFSAPFHAENAARACFNRMSSYLDEDKGIEEIRLIARGEILECAKALTLEALYSQWTGETAEQ
jgi:hypothetical protein